MIEGGDNYADRQLFAGEVSHPGKGKSAPEAPEKALIRPSCHPYDRSSEARVTIVGSDTCYVPVTLVRRSNEHLPNVMSFEELYLAHRDFVRRSARRMGVGHADIEDITQETFIVAYRKLGNFRGDSKVSTWLYSILFNLFRNYQRKQRKAGERVSEEELKSTAVHLASQREFLSDVFVLSFLSGLEPNQRSVFVLRALEGATIKETCSAMNMSPHAVQREYQSAKTAFKAASTSEFEYSHTTVSGWYGILKGSGMLACRDSKGRVFNYDLNRWFGSDLPLCFRTGDRIDLFKVDLGSLSSGNMMSITDNMKTSYGADSGRGVIWLDCHAKFRWGYLTIPPNVPAEDLVVVEPKPTRHRVLLRPGLGSPYIAIDESSRHLG